MTDISVIVPVYNAEDTIVRCLESLKHQTFLCAEFIIINDGSTDRTLSIIQNFVDYDSRFHIINQENKGVSAARNAGLNYSSGKYIMFVDSDDELVTEKVLQHLFDLMEAENADILSFGYNIVEYHKVRRGLNIKDCRKKIIVSDDYVSGARNTIFSNEYRTSVWNKIYRADIILSNNIRFKSYSDVISEDKTFNIHVFVFAKKILLVNDIFYNYYILSTSLSHTKTFSNVSKRVITTIQETTLYINYLKKNIQGQLFWPIYLDCISICVELLYRFNHESFKDTMDQTINVLKDTECLRIKFDDKTNTIARYTNNRTKNILFSIARNAVRKNQYKKVVFLFIIKAMIRRICI